MKKQIKLTALIAPLFLLFLVSCDDDTLELLPPEEAKKEISDASKSIANDIEEMQNAPAFETFNQFSYLLGEEPMKLKSFAKAGLYPKTFAKKSDQFTVKALNLKAEKGDIDPIENKGVYEYDFDSDKFDLVDENVDYLAFLFPADQDALDNQDNNAEFRINEIRVVEDDDGFEIPTKIDLWLKVDDETILSLYFTMELDQDYEPTDITLNLTAVPYSLDMTFSRTGPDSDMTINSTAFLKINNSTIMSYSINVSGDMDKDAPDVVEGNIQFVPLKFEGSANILAIVEHEEEVYDDEANVDLDVDYLNEQIDIDIIHTELNKKIGHLEFYHVGFVGDEPAEDVDIIVVYEDGTYELIEEAMPELATMFEDFDL